MEGNKKAQKKEDGPKTFLQQFNDLKKKHPDALLMFRNRDFYELYRQDALKAGAVLGLTLANQIVKGLDEKVEKVKVATFPYYDLDTYLPKLIKAGNRVAIVDKFFDPKLEKLAKEGIDAIKEKGKKADETSQNTLNNTNDMPKKKKDQAVQEEPVRATAKTVSGDKPAEKNQAEQKNAAKTEQKPQAEKEQKKEAKASPVTLRWSPPTVRKSPTAMPTRVRQTLMTSTLPPR